MLCITFFNYANAILYGLPKSTLGIYQTIHNMCAKLILNRSKFSSSSLALKELHWLPIEQRIKYKILTSTFKCITGTSLKNIEDLINTKNRRDNMHSNNNGITLQNPKSITKPLQQDPSSILHQHYGTSYQGPSENDQTWITLRRN